MFQSSGPHTVPSNVCQKEFILIYHKHIDSPSASSHLSELPKCFKRETCVKPVLTLWFLSHKFALPFVKRWSLLKWPSCVFLYVYSCVNCKFSLFCKPGRVCGSESHALCVDFAVSGQKDPQAAEKYPRLSKWPLYRWQTSLALHLWCRWQEVCDFPWFIAISCSNMTN